MKNAIRVAHSFAKDRMVEKISNVLSQLEDQMPELDGEVIAAMFSKGGELSVDGMARKRGREEESEAAAEQTEE